MWRRVRRYYALFRPIRSSFIALAILVFGFCIADQGADILRAMTEDQFGWRKLRVTTFLTASMTLALTIWYWSRHLLRFRPHARRQADPCHDPDEEPLVEEHEFATRWTPRVVGLLVFAIELAGLGIVAWQYRRAARETHASPAQLGPPVSHEKLWILMGLLVVEAAAYWLIVVRRRELLVYVDRRLGRPRRDRFADMHTTVRSWRELDPTTLWMLGATVGAEVVLFAWAVLDPVSWWILGVAAVLVLTIGIWIPIGSVLVALAETWRCPVLGILAAWAVLISPLTDNHAIRVVDGPHDRPSIDDAFRDWYARMRRRPEYASGERPIPAIVVAAEGGGIRAAYWTATVLAALQDKMPAFADHCFAISGVSGGSLGAVLFDALLAWHGEHGPPKLSLQSDVHEVLDFDALSGTLAALSQPDFMQRFWPAPWFPDRAAALELGWERGWSRALPDAHSRSLLSDGFLATMKQHPELPKLFLNGTVVEDGSRIITSQVRLRSALEFRSAYDALDLLRSDIPMSSAAGMSTRFTYLSPAGIIPTRDATGELRGVFGHVIDGGYFENSGAVTAGEIVAFLQRPRKERVRPVVILVDHRKTDRRTMPRRGDTTPFCPAPGRCGPAVPERPERFANETLSPLRGLLNTRDARGFMALADLLHHMRRDGDDHDLVDFRVTPRDVPLPLGWVLSEDAMDRLWRAVDCEGGNRAAVAVVAGWLGATPAPAQCDAEQFPVAVPPPPVRCDDAGCTGASVPKGEQ